MGRLSRVEPGSRSDSIGVTSELDNISRINLALTTAVIQSCAAECNMKKVLIERTDINSVLESISGSTNRVYITISLK